MTNQPPRTRAEAKQAQASRSRSPRSSTSAGPAADRPSTRRKWLKRAGWAFLGLVLLGIAGFGIAYASVDIPAPNEIATAQASIVYYADGETEMARLSDPEGNRESVPLDQISEDMQHAILAAEDQEFYSNSGISPTGIARAVWVAIRGGSATQGGSTITQQYVKNYFLTQDRTLTRKAKELIISLKIDRELSKDQILENYLNTIYYGRGAYGIETAAQAYFGVHAADLDASQSALLASVIRGPSLYDPTLGDQQRANAEERWGYILDAMAKNDWLTPDERAAAQFPEVKEYKPQQLGGTSGYVVDLVKKELVDTYKLTDSDIQRGGLRVVSTIDKPKQDAAVAAVKEQRPDAGDIHVGLVSITPGDGAVEALYGGEDFATRQLNNATQATMQAGSTFKIFALIAGLQSGDMSTRSRFDGRSPQYFPEFADPNASTDFGRRGGVTNFGDEQFGRIDLLTATQHSVNTVYAQVNIEAGPENTMKVAQDAGVRSELTPNLANVLGTDSVTVMDMANAYATIAAEGVRATPYLVKQVKFLDAGVPEITAEPETQRVFDKDLMSDVIDAMQQTVKPGGTAQYVGQNLGRPAAGKTGTSEDFKSAWFDGFVPQLGAAVGMYRADESGGELEMKGLPGIGDITGGSFPARIWTSYMRTAVDGMDVEQFPEPAHINKGADPAPSTTVPPPPTTSAPPSTTTSAPPPTTSAPPPTTSAPPPTTSAPPPTPTDTATTTKPGVGTGKPSPTATANAAAPPSG
jgi:membrane peptidoglycan carboxypeptidase